MNFRQRAKHVIALSALGAQVMACYSLDPTFGSAPRLDSHVAFDINDVGRVALGGPVAPEIARIEGRLISMDSSEYVLGVTGLRSIRGYEQVWTGEPVHIKREYVGTTYEQHFSAVRTTALVAATAGVVALVADKALQGFATNDQGGATRGDSMPAIRIPRFPRGAHLITRW